MHTIYLADDHQLILDGLKGILSHLPNIQICGEANTLEQAEEALIRLKPTIALVDVRMPSGTEGIRLLQIAAKHKLPTHFIMLSMHHDARIIQDAKQWGAKGYLLKNSGKEILFTAIQTVLQGGKYFTDLPKTLETNKVVFTPKEWEVIELILAGLSSAEIANKLSIAEETAKVHRRNIRSKTGTTNTAELIKWLRDRGMI